MSSALAGSRTSATTSSSRSRSLRTTWPPMKPVPPVTKTFIATQPSSRRRAALDPRHRALEQRVTVGLDVSAVTEEDAVEVPLEDPLDGVPRGLAVPRPDPHGPRCAGLAVQVLEPPDKARARRHAGVDRRVHQQV